MGPTLRRRSPRARRSCLTVEAMEHRLLLSPIPVSDTLDDTNPGSLRWAVGQANAQPGSTIVFQIPGTGVQTIALASPLPELTAAVTIDGTTQTGYSGSPPIELDGATAVAAASPLDIVIF